MNRPINRFLLQNKILIATNPCISPDFCLDWESLAARLKSGVSITAWSKSHFDTAAGRWTLMEDNTTGDCAWHLEFRSGRPEIFPLDSGISLSAQTAAFPATWENLLKLKNLVQEHDASSTIFPSAEGKLSQSTIGVGARFTTLHWPAVEWAMGALGIGMTANQNSIPRELVYDVDAMLEGRLDTVPFPFIGTNVPEGHQGQSVEGMSHGCVLSKLKTGFHRRHIAWSFNADHQPIGGKFDVREDALVNGCILASYITFDLSPELARQQPANIGDIDPALVIRVRERVAAAGISLNDKDFTALLCAVWPSMRKMQVRDAKYRAAREKAFSCELGRKFLRELSIDELPGLTTPETTAVMLALCELLGMPVNFIAPAFGFQKNMPYPDNAELRKLIERQWAVCEKFGVSIGFHSGSGKSAENYQIMGEVTGSRLEIKTSGRYTYEMGIALYGSEAPSDKKLWADWYRFTLELGVAGAFSTDPVEQKMARSFIIDALSKAGKNTEVFASTATCREALEALPVSPNHMFFFEYNFLYVLAAGGQPQKSALGDHSPAGYAQRARFYAIDQDARLRFTKGVASYLIFLAENTKLASLERCKDASKKLAAYNSLSELLDDIAL